MARPARQRLTADRLGPELDQLINNHAYVSSIPEDLSILIHKVFFVHTLLEGQLEMRTLYKLCEEQLSIPGREAYGMTETMRELTRKLTYTDMLALVRGFKDGAPCGTLEKIHAIRNDFSHSLSGGWRDQYSSKISKIEVLQLLIVGIKSMEDYMEKVRKALGISP